MPSERRLHPLSIVFNIGKHFGALLIPLAVVLVGRGTDEDRWNAYLLLMLVPYAAFAIGRYLTFRYRYEPGELVIRDGLFVRNQRHIPYDRIQNIDAIQHVLHRLTGVVEVKVQTGSGTEPEATLSVLSVADLDEMRRRVFAVRARAHAEDAAAEAEHGPAPRTLLHLRPGDLALYGVIENRGLVVIGAALGLLSESDVISSYVERVAGEQAGHGFFRSIGLTVASGQFRAGFAVYAAGLLVAFLLISRLFSILWAQVRLHGYTLTQIGEDLRVEYGLITRVTATVPLRRIQEVTVRDTPLHRWLGLASVSVTTAGGTHGEHEHAPQHREWLAPLIRREAIPALIVALMPGTDPASFAWQRVHARALRRALTRATIATAIVTILLTALLGVRGLWLALPLAAWAGLRAKLLVANLAWALTPDVVAARHGALVRFMSVAPLVRIQAVEQTESPFDRLSQMARLRADIAGGGGSIDVPYLPVETATQLYQHLSAAAAHTAFRW